MTHSEWVLLTQSSLPSSLAALAPSCQDQPGGSGTTRDPCTTQQTRAVVVGGVGRRGAGERRQASGGLRADHVVSCGRDFRILSAQSSAGQPGPAIQPCSPRPASSSSSVHRGLVGPAGRAGGKLSHTGTCAPGLVAVWCFAPATQRWCVS